MEPAATTVMSPSTDPTPEMEQDPAEALMREVGAQLRQVREERGERLEDVADTLRIKPVYLYGIERGELSVMPGRTYALGFLRSYADYLGFDGDDLIGQIRTIVEDLTDRTRLEMKTPLHESRVPKGPVIALSMAMLAGVYVGWTFLQGSDEQPEEVIAEVPENLRSIAVGALPAGDGTVEEDESPATNSDDSDDGAPPADIATDESPPPAGGVDVAVSADRSPAEASHDAAAPDTAARAVADARTVGEVLPAEAAGETPATDLGQPPSASEGAPGRSDPNGTLAGMSPEAGPEPAAGPIDLEPAPVQQAEPVQAQETPRSNAAPDGDARAANNQLGRETDEAPTIETLLAAAPAAPPTAAQVVAELQRSPTDVAAVRPQDAGPPAVLEEINSDARVVLHAVGPSWIRITSVSGDYLRTRTLEAGDIFLVPNRDDLELWTGNAGGIELIVDGEPIAPLGPEGTVVRDVSLDPARLRPPAERQNG